MQSDADLNSRYSSFYDQVLEIQNARNTTLFTDIDFVKKYAHLILAEVFGAEDIALYTEYLVFDEGDNWFLVFSKPFPKHEPVNGIIVIESRHYTSIGVIIRKTNGELISLTKF